MTRDNGGCSGEQQQQESQLQSEDIKQATPFNIGTFGVLFVFCIIIALTSSLYYNWPAIERILVDDKVFQNLCTKDEIYNAIDGMFVCDEQRKQIGNLALIIFYTEFIAFAIGGLLTDIVGIGSVLTLAFVFGFSSFIILYCFYMDNFMIKLAFALWGMFGGFIFITSIQFPKMFPEATSLADGMIILFDNISGLIPIVIYKLMKKFNLKYYEAFGTYILWGIVPCFILTLSFIPSVIVSNNKNGNNTFNINCIGESLGKHQLWLNYIIFSIPVTCSIFYKKTFSTYFLKNQTLVKIFPIIMLFVFVPTIFIAALNQFMGVHITSCILYIFYIISFVCFLYPTKQYGLLSIILFVISTSAAEQQTMTYISENHQQNESTLLGISYAVDFIIGSILQRIFDRIYDRSPMSILYVTIPLFLICIAYSLYCATQKCNKNNNGHTKSPSFNGLFIIFWFIPFLLLCLILSFNYFKSKKHKIYEMSFDKSKITEYHDEKKTIVSIMFYSFTFYYICDSFMVITSIIKFTCAQPFSDHKYYGLFYFLTCFLIIPQIFIFIIFRQSGLRHFNLLTLTGFLFILKMGLLIFSNSEFTKTVILTFSIFLMIYGFVFFLFIYMLAYYNFQITYVDRCYKTSLLHWGSMISLFILFKLFYNILSQYEFGFLILWAFNICFFIYFAMVLYFYIPYEMDIQFNFNSSNLPVPKFSEFDLLKNFSSNDCNFYYIIGAVSLSILSFGVLTNIRVNLIIWLLVISSLYDITVVVLRIYHNAEISQEQYIKYLNYSLTGLSVVSFLLLFIIRLFSRNSYYEKSNFISFLKFINILVILLNSNISWLNIQYDLQKCCCTENNCRKCSCCECCCICKEEDVYCKCCDNIGKCCCCCGKECESCKCDPPCCKKCASDKCKNCVCRCLKKFKEVAKDNPTIIFCFYECNFKKVDECFLWYYLGTISGWLLFTIHLGTSKETVLLNILR